MMVGVPLALGSFWGLAVLAVILPGLIWRILDEEKLLKKDLPGYIDYTQTVTVNSGQTTPLAISMQTAPTPTPASAPSRAIVIGGIVMAAGIGAALRRRS